jgi:hypothetical protein
MTVLDPDILNPFALLDPSIAASYSIFVTIASIFFCSIISMYFFRTYKFSGFGYLLGLPIGFAVIAISFVFEHLSLISYNYSHTNSFLYTAFFWIQLTLQSEGLALIALSYMLKNRTNVVNGWNVSKPFLSHSSVVSSSTRLKDILITILPMVVISVPIMVTMSALFVQPILNDTELNDLSIYTRVFNIVILGYILRNALASLVKAANIKLLYVPAVFGLLWLEQYSLIITYFDSDLSAFIGSILARLAGLTLFVYAIRYAISKSRISGDIKIETREET